MFRYKHYCDITQACQQQNGIRQSLPCFHNLAIITTKIRRPHNQLFRQRCQYVTNCCIDVAKEVSPTAVSYEHFRIPRTLVLLLNSFHISVAQQPKWGLGRLTVQVSRSPTIRHTHTNTRARAR